MVSKHGLQQSQPGHDSFAATRKTATRTDEQTPARQKGTNIDIPLGRIKHVEISHARPWMA